MVHGSLLRAVVAVVVILDQASKVCVRHWLALGERITLIDGLLDLLHVENRGMVWGLMAGRPLRLPVMTLFGLLSFVFLLGWFVRLSGGDRLAAISLSLLIAGATGNFIDRLLYRSVTDFVELSVPPPLVDWAQTMLGTSRWAVFNVADVAITAGLGLLLVAAVGAPRPSGGRELR